MRRHVPSTAIGARCRCRGVVSFLVTAIGAVAPRQSRSLGVSIDLINSGELYVYRWRTPRSYSIRSSHYLAAAQSVIAPPLGDNTQTECARSRNEREELHLAQTPVGLRALSGVANSPSTVLSDSTAALEPLDSTGDASLVTAAPRTDAGQCTGLGVGGAGGPCDRIRVVLGTDLSNTAVARHRDLIHGESSREWLEAIKVPRACRHRHR